MPKLISKTKPAHRNLPAIIGGHKIQVTLISAGPLAGYTIVEGDERAVRHLRTDGWVDADQPPEAKPDPEPPQSLPSHADPAGDLAPWAEELVSRSITSLKDELDVLDPGKHNAAHVRALLVAEATGKDRVGATEAILYWANGVPEWAESIGEE